ncbi:MAG TPA: type II secretion system protein GspK [Polyangiaceae bacterium]|jgi:general secretion pathway protein K
MTSAAAKKLGARKVRAKKRAKEAGIALIMVLGAIAVLTVMLAEFQDDASTELASAMADRDSVQAEYMARSAVNLSRLLIASEPTIRGAIAPLFMLMRRTPPQLPVWEFSDKLLGAFNDSEGAKDFAGTTGVDLSLGKNLGLPGGHWELVIVDEDSKIDANLGASNDIAHIRLAKELMGLMAPPTYDPLFSQRDPQGNVSDRMSICSALIDWADPDDNLFSCDMSTNAPSGSGKEDAYYQLLTKPYFRKNAPFDSLEELHMVRGFSEDFWSTFVDPDPTNPKKRVLTVWGQGAVNVNTANPLTLLGILCSGTRPGAPVPSSSSTASPLVPMPTATAAPATPAAGVNPNLPALCTDPNQTSLFIMAITMAKGITMGAPLFGSPQDFISMMKGQGMIGPLLAMIGVQPVSFQSESEFAKAITTESKMFSMYAVGVIKGYKRETRVSIHEVVDFRTAPVVSAAPAASGLAGMAMGAAAPPPQPVASSSASADPNSIAAAMQPSTGGQVVYFHLE